MKLHAIILVSCLIFVWIYIKQRVDSVVSTGDIKGSQTTGHSKQDQIKGSSPGLGASRLGTNPNSKRDSKHSAPSIPKSLWLKQQLDMFDLDFRLTDDAVAALDLESETRDLLENLLVKTKTAIRTSESERMTAKKDGSKISITIPPLDKTTAAMLRSEFELQAKNILGAEKLDFFLTLGKKSLFLNTGNFGEYGRSVLLEPGVGDPKHPELGGGLWKVAVVAYEKTNSSGEPNGELQMKSFYFNEIPDGLSHLMEIEEK